MFEQRLIFFTVVSFLIFISCRETDLNTYEPDYTEISGTAHIIKPADNDLYYQGDEIEIVYESFSRVDYINVYIERKGYRWYTIERNHPNDGRLIWKTDRSTTPTLHYKIRITDAFNEDRYMLSGEFALKRKE